MLDPQWAKAFARDWIDAWNSGDMNRIPSHYSEHFQMSSPLVEERLGDSSGTLVGKKAVSAYWEPSLATDPPLRFELIDVLVGIDSITLYYRNVGRRIVAETLLFDESRRVIKGMSQWSVVADPVRVDRGAKGSAHAAEVE